MRRSSGSCASSTRAGRRRRSESRRRCDVRRGRRRINDVTSFAQAAETHLDDVFGSLTALTGDRFVAEDLTGETFERALRLWHRFDERRGSARTWLCQVARTVALDHFRSEKRRARREQLAAVPESFEERLAEGLSPEVEAA